MDDRIKKSLLGFLLLLLLFPVLEQCINFIHSANVYGDYHIAKDPAFSFEDWWEGKFQQDKNSFLNDNTGFRPDMVRLNNQIDFSVFDKVHFFYGKLGKDRCLWDELYINAYLGTDYIGYDSIHTKLKKLKKIQDTLTSLGKTFVFVHAPCKGFFYPEYMPDEYSRKKRGTTNIETYLRIGDSLGINQINFNAWFLSLKSKAKEIIYPKQGIHWSVYGSALAEDSLVSYIEKKKGINMVHYTCEGIDHTVEARSTDDDLSKPLNLFSPASGEVFAYPVLRYPDENKKTKPRAIYIGDSFYFQWMYLGLFQHINSDWQMWFYFHELCSAKYAHGDQSSPVVTDTDWLGEISKADYVVLMVTAKNLPDLGNGFIEKAYDHYYPKK